MPRRPILSSSPGSPDPDDSSFSQGFRHDALFPGFGAVSPLAGRQIIEREVRETDLRLDHLLEEKRNLERKRLELQELNDKQTQFRERRDKIVEEVLRTLNELQKTGHFEIRRADTFERAGSNAQRLRLNLEALQRLELKDPDEHPRLVEGIRRLRDAEAELEGEMNRLEDFEGTAPVTHLFASVAPERRSLLKWLRLGFSFFLPVIVVGFLAVMIVVAFAGK
jgi:hypothetical protein